MARLRNDLRRLTLHDTHESLGARMVEFAGWAMPEHYGSIIEEHLQVRRHAGLFDVSHMGRLLIRGPEAVETVRRLVAADVLQLESGRAKYTFLTAPWGGILDDLIVYRRPDGLLLVVNASRTLEDRAWIEERLLPDTSLDDLTELTCLFALQGPDADRIVSSLASMDPGTLKSFAFAPARLAGRDVSLMRTGYTGELGVEILAAAEDAEAIWEAILAAGEDGSVQPCGLGARDSLRLEAGLLLHGQDMDAEVTPFEVGLGRLVDLDRPDFIGRDPLLAAAQGEPERKLVGLSAPMPPIPRPGDGLIAEGQPVGRVTSGTYSPILGHPIALGMVDQPWTVLGTELTVKRPGKDGFVRVAELPFYRRGVTPIPEERASGSSLGMD